MELLLITIGSVLAAAIVMMIVEWVRGVPFNELDDPFDHTGYDDPVLTPEIRERLRRKRKRKK